MTCSCNDPQIGRPPQAPATIREASACDIDSDQTEARKCRLKGRRELLEPAPIDDPHEVAALELDESAPLEIR